MAHYLLVANQTAASDALLRKVREIVRDDPDARFTVLVPATPVNHFLTWSDQEATDLARRAAEAAAERIQGVGTEVVRTVIGDRSALTAIKDELLARPGEYNMLVICTLPAGVSRWLRADMVTRAQRLGLPVIHVTAAKAPVPAGMR